MFVKRKYEANNTIEIFLKKGKANTTEEYKRVSEVQVMSALVVQ